MAVKDFALCARDVRARTFINFCAQPLNENPGSASETYIFHPLALVFFILIRVVRFISSSHSVHSLQVVVGPIVSDELRNIPDGYAEVQDSCGEL